MEYSGESKQQTTPLKEGSLTPEDLARCDEDIHTMSALHVLAGEYNAQSVISGGYAVEAHCEGTITRPHRDMDVHWYIDTSLPIDTILSKIQETLGADTTLWRSQEKKSQEKYQFDELSQSGGKGRRLEWSVERPSPTKGYEMKFLIDSQGNKHEILVPPIAEVVARKVIIFSIKNEMTPEEKAADTRYTGGKSQDAREFKRLIALPTFDQDACKEFLQGYVTYKKKLEGEVITSVQAHTLAQKEWHDALEFINTSESTE
jgi:hypothetical protein